MATENANRKQETGKLVITEQSDLITWCARRIEDSALAERIATDAWSQANGDAAAAAELAAAACVRHIRTTAAPSLKAAEAAAEAQAEARINEMLLAPLASSVSDVDLSTEQPTSSKGRLAAVAAAGVALLLGPLALQSGPATAVLGSAISAPGATSLSEPDARGDAGIGNGSGVAADGHATVKGAVTSRTADGRTITKVRGAAEDSDDTVDPRTEPTLNLFGLSVDPAAQLSETLENITR